MLCLCVLAMAIIYILSSFPASESSQQSGAISGLLGSIFGGELTPQGQSTLEAVVRKIAHVLEYAALGGLWYGYFLCYEFAPAKKVGFTLLVSIAYAVSDEVHQYFVPGRAARLYDVGFDTLGILAGILAVTVILNLFKRRNPKWKQK